MVGYMQAMRPKYTEQASHKDAFPRAFIAAEYQCYPRLFSWGFCTIEAAWNAKRGLPLFYPRQIIL